MTGTELSHLLERELGRPLTQYEQDICDHPRVCLVTGGTEDLKNCRECFCVAYSAKAAEEAKKRHAEFCAPLRKAAEDYRCCNNFHNGLVFFVVT